MWPSGVYLLLAGLVVSIEQQTPGSVSWEQLGIAGAVISFGGTVFGLFAKGVIRFGYQVDKEQAIADARLAEQKVVADKQLADCRADNEKRYAELVAQSNQRLQDTITEWRARYAELGQDRDFWRQNAMKPVAAVERLTDVVEALKKGLEQKDGS